MTMAFPSRLRLMAAALLSLVITITHAQDSTPSAEVEPDPAQEAYLAELERLQAERAQRPGDGLLAFYQAAVHAELGQREPALAALRSLLGRRLGLIPAPDQGFDKLWADAEFQTLRQQLADQEPRTAEAPVAFSLPDPRLIPEGIAYDAATRRLFLSSVAQHKIVVVAADGKVQDFSKAEDGLDAVLGLAVDARRRRLCAVSTNAFEQSASQGRRNAVLCYDLKTGALQQRYPIEKAKQLNDVAVAPDGSWYASDSAAGTLYRLAPKATEFTRQRVAGRMRGANGVAPGPDGAVYVTLSSGVARIDPQTGESHRMPQPDSVVAGGIDGLYWWRGSLLGVQNGTNPGRVIRLTLSRDGRRITGLTVLQSHHHPAFSEPTTGVVVHGRFHVIANSHIGLLQADGGVREPSRLRGTQVLSIPLPR